MATPQDDGYPPSFKGEGDTNPWNSDAFVKANNNCYDYAFNQRDPRPTTAEELDAYKKKKKNGQMSVPGKKADKQAQKPYTCDKLIQGVKDDNKDLVHESDKDKKCDANCWKVVLMIKNEGKETANFHWLRQDADGDWSHKDDGKPATRKDDKGNDIKDPEKAALDDYKVCKYFCVCKGATVAVVTPRRTREPLVAFCALLSPAGDDPLLPLRPALAQEVAAKLVDLPPTERRPVYRMGYGGFEIRNNSKRRDLPPLTRVVQGLVCVSDEEGRERWSEDVNDLERWLLALAGERRIGALVRAAIDDARRGRSAPARE